MSEKPAYVHAPWDVDKNDPWGNPVDTLQGNGLTFAELQKKYPLDSSFGREWKLMRTSKRGNRVMYGQHTKGCDIPGTGGGKAFAYYVTTIVRPDGVVAQYTVVYDEWDY
jgi:hypothetical protein